MFCCLTFNLRRKSKHSLLTKFSRSFSIAAQSSKVRRRENLRYVFGERIANITDSPIHTYLEASVEHVVQRLLWETKDNYVFLSQISAGVGGTDALWSGLARHRAVRCCRPIHRSVSQHRRLLRTGLLQVHDVGQVTC